MTAPNSTPQAACADPAYDLAWWFPKQGDIGLRAKRICVDCPVRLACLAGRLERGEDGGIWGGHGEGVGRRLRRMWRVRTDAGWPSIAAFLVFVATVADEGGRLRVEAQRGRAPEGAPNRNGPGASCGTVASYKKGCHCGACSFAVASSERRKRLAQEDVAA